MATKDFLSAGINCIEYKNGRRVNIKSYAEMALRTANKRAYGARAEQWREKAEELEKLQKRGYNIFDISEYASNKLNEQIPRLDEIYTEYRVKNLLK